MKYLYDLEPQYDRRKSFYGKAKVYSDDAGHLLLMSYSTIVAEITDGIATEDGRPSVKVNGWDSSTTATIHQQQLDTSTTFYISTALTQ